MAFVFGWYSFNLKSYSAEELNLDSSQWVNTSFEVRQEVFHLFWIPVFSLGKLYVLRKENKLYDLPANIASKIKTKGKIRTPWYSFLLPILALVIPLIVGVYIYVAESIMGYKNDKRDKELYDASIVEIKNNLENLSENAYFQITNTENFDYNETTFLKLIGRNGDTYTFQKIKLNFPKDANQKYGFEETDFPNITITKKELQKAVCEDYEIYSKHIPYGVNFFKTGKSIITKIDYFDKPIITGNEDWYFLDIVRRRTFNYKHAYWENGFKVTLDFQNFGTSCDLVEIKNLQDNIKWDSLPIKFPKYVYLKEVEIKGYTKINNEDLKIKSVFTFQDSLKNKQKYIIEGSEYIYTIKKL